MALNVFELFGKIAIDSSGAEKGIKNTVNHAKDAEGKLTKTFKKIGTAVAAAFSVKAIVDFGKQCTEAYASIAAEESAFAQIMGDYADTANAKLKAVSDATGVSTTRMTSAMTSLTAKFKGLGYNVEDATTLATDGLLIATDAAAFWDMSLDESMSHLNSFINGSYEGGEAIGLFANDTQMAAYAVEKGIVKDTKAWAKLNEAQKQATRLDYAKKMMAESGATGQAAKEADSYANVMANLKEGWRQFLGVVGKPVLEKFVLPAMQKLNDFLPKLTESVTNGIAWLEEGFDKIASYFTEVFTEDGLNMDALPNALKNMFRDLGRGVGSMLTSFGRTLQNTWNNTVWPMTQRALKAAFGIDVPAWSEIEKTVKDWWDGGNGIAKEIANVCNWTLNLFGAPATVTAEDVSKVLSTWWTNTKGFVQNACQWALGIFQRPASVTLSQVKATLSNWWNRTKLFAQKACNWALDLFGAPEGTTEDKVKAVLSSWWTTVCGWVAGACNWALDLFGAPEGTTEDKVKAVLSSWWTTVCGWVANACNWALDLFGAPEGTTEDKVKAILSSWWSGVAGWVANACNWTLNLFGAPANVTAEDVSGVLSTWWTNTAGFVQSACTWALGLFQQPVSVTLSKVKATLSNWWNRTKLFAQKACDWALDLFGAPEGTTEEKVKAVLSSWWSGVSGWVANACNWVLTLFGAPAEVTEEEVSGVLSAWWTNTVGFVQTACKWALGLFGAPEGTTEEDVKAALSSWWSGVTGWVANACNWVLNLFGAPAEVDAEGVSSVLSTWWENTVGYVQDACNWVLNMFGPPVDTEGKSAVGVITEWWEGVRANIEAACTWTLESPDASALDKLIAKFVLYIVTGKFAKDATKALSDAFAGIGTAVETVCGWIGDFVRWLNDGSDGATAFKAAIVGATAALIVYKLVVGATAVWTAFIEIIKKVKAAFLALNLTMALNPVGLVIAAIVGLIVAFIYLWNKSEGFRQFWIDAWDWICKAVSDSVDAIKGFFDSIVGWWNSITNAVNGAIASVKEFLGLNATPPEYKPGTSNPANALGSPTGGGAFGATMTQFGWDDTDAPLNLPGFATGLDYVPRDNFLARLHQGEAVLTRNEADAWRNGSGTAKLESALAQVADLLRDIARNTGADKSVVLDSGALVGQLAPGMNAYLGHRQRLNGRGNA